MRAYGILVEDDRVLLVRSSNPEHVPPLWWLPGGGIEFAETPHDTLRREFAEETGLLVRDPELLEVTSDLRRRANGERLHTVRIIYRVARDGGELRDEAHGTTDRAQWFPLAEAVEMNLAAFARDVLTRLYAK